MPRTRAAREGGFSMLIVLILLIMLVGIAMVLLTTSRGDVSGATNERESAIAFYAAEAGIAHGKAFMGTVPFSDATKFTAVLNQTLESTQLSKTFDYTLPNGATVPVSYVVTFSNNIEGTLPDAGMTDGGAVDRDGIIIVHSEGFGPNGSHAVIEVATGKKDSVKIGRDYCAQANPPPSCRGM